MFFKLAAIGVTALSLASGQALAGPVKNIVLVHGAWADGSGWRGVYDILKKDGYTVSIVQEPNTSLADDAAAAKRVVDQQNGPVILVGHSYGGMVVTEAGNDAKVAGLVYIAAWVPDKGGSLASLGANPPKGAPPVPVLPPVDGYLWLDQTKFVSSFAADVDPATAVFMGAAQVPFAASCFTAQAGEPAWKTKPNWYMVAGADKMIPPETERMMAKHAGAKLEEVNGASHAVYVSHPKEVAALIEKAAGAAQAN
jgi:pimeloyl-ACP methyl ester carboxylesterase